MSRVSRVSRGIRGSGDQVRGVTLRLANWETGDTGTPGLSGNPSGDGSWDDGWTVDIPMAECPGHSWTGDEVTRKTTRK